MKIKITLVFLNFFLTIGLCFSAVFVPSTGEFKTIWSLTNVATDENHVKAALFFHNGSAYFAINQKISFPSESFPIQRRFIKSIVQIPSNQNLSVIQINPHPFVRIDLEKSGTTWKIIFSYHDKTEIFQESTLCSRFKITPDEDGYSISEGGLGNEFHEFFLNNQRLGLILSSQINRGASAKRKPYNLLFSRQGLAFILSPRDTLKEKKVKGCFFLKKAPTVVGGDEEDETTSFFFWDPAKNFLKVYHDHIKSFYDKKTVTESENLQNIWFEIAAGNGAEAKGLLDLYFKDNPELKKRRNCARLYAMALILQEDYENAIALLKPFKGNLEIDMWMAFCRAIRGYVEEFSPYADVFPDFLTIYPPQLCVFFLGKMLPILGLFEAWSSIIPIYQSLSKNDLTSLGVEQTMDWYVLQLSERGKTFALDRPRKSIGQFLLESWTPLSIRVLAKFKTLKNDLHPLGGPPPKEEEKERIFQELERLRFEERNEFFEYNIAKFLISEFEKENKYKRSLEYVQDMLRLYPMRSTVEGFEAWGHSLVRMFFKKSEQTSSFALKKIGLYQRFSEFFSPDDLPLVVQAYEDLDLLEEGAEFLSKIAGGQTSLLKKHDILLRVAEMRLQNRQFESSLSILNGLPTDLYINQDEKRMILKALSLWGLNRIPEALECLEKSTQIEPLKLACEIAVQSSLWDIGEKKLAALDAQIPESDPFKDRVLLHRLVLGHLNIDTKNLDELRKIYKNRIDNNPLLAYWKQEDRKQDIRTRQLINDFMDETSLFLTKVFPKFFKDHAHYFGNLWEPSVKKPTIKRNAPHVG